MIHELKLLSKYYPDSLTNKKNFEIRKNDRDFKVGDAVKLKEWNRGKYTGKEHIKEITYILDDSDYLQNGYVCLGLKPLYRL